MKGEVAPTKLFIQVPGIGKELAQRIVEELDVSTLAELEQAAHDGRLEEMEGFGEERVRNVRVGLAGMLSTAVSRRRRRAGGEEEEPEEQPGVGVVMAFLHQPKLLILDAPTLGLNPPVAQTVLQFHPTFCKLF